MARTSDSHWVYEAAGLVDATNENAPSATCFILFSALAGCPFYRARMSFAIGLSFLVCHRSF
jgi:hypothetical protein